MSSKKIVIGIVGPCAAGKTSLVRRLRNGPHDIHHIAQEHSYVPDMWKRISNPHILIYLDVSYKNTVLRKHLNWTIEEYLEQLNRLKHAREHADLLIVTDSLSEEAVFEIASKFINEYLKKIDTP